MTLDEAGYYKDFNNLYIKILQPLEIKQMSPGIFG